MADDRTKIVYCADACYKGLFIGGESSGDQSVKINIKQQSNSTLFAGLLQNDRFGCKATSNGYIAVIGGNSFFSPDTTILDSMLIVEESNSTTFGNLLISRASTSVCTDGVVSMWVGGDGVLGYQEGMLTIETVAFDTGGTASIFGDVAQQGLEGGFAASDNTIAIFGGITDGYVDNRRVDIVTFATGGNSSTFGQLLQPRYDSSSVEDATQAIIWSGKTYEGYSWAYSNDIEYILFDTGGTASSFGNLDTGREYAESCEDATTGIFGTGYNGSYYTQYDYVTMAIQSNSTTFGNLWGDWDRHHEYGSTSGNCSLPCDDSTVFNLYSYITFDQLDFDTNMENILLFDAKDTDVDLNLIDVTTTDRLDVSLDNLRTLHITNSIFNTGKTIYYTSITDITIEGLNINTSSVYHENNFTVCEIDKSNVFVLDMDINVVLDDTIESLDVVGVETNNTFVKEMNITLQVDP